MEVIRSLRILLRHRNVVNKRITNKVYSVEVNNKSLPEIKLTKNELNSLKDNELLKEITENLSPLFKTNNPSDNLFVNVRNDIINKHLIPEKSVDIKIIDTCMKNTEYELAKSYFDYLKCKNYPLNKFILLKYLQLLCSNKIPITNFIEEDIINICDMIQKDYECLPSSILSTCVNALCLTNKWETAFDLIKVNGTSEDANTATLTQIAMAAFKNGKPKIGFELLDEITNNYDVDIRESLYDVYLDYYLLNEKENLNNAIKKMFTFWEKHDIVPFISIIDKFVDVCKESGWEGHHVKISNGQCSHCKNYLSSITSNYNFGKLSKAVISDLIISEDIFRKTSPLELKNFKIFVNKLKPFDIVIDGLNLFYQMNFHSELGVVIKKFVNEGNKILFITRKHNYKKSKWLFNHDNLYVYFLKDTTKDDPFILYATLASGNNAKFVSDDQMRQYYHEFKKLNLHKSFIRWQFSHQYTFLREDTSDRIALLEPVLHNPFAQVQNGHWHIPYKDSQKALHKPSQTWVCLCPPNK
ncbi:hypothetical protein M0802_015148 [Mischocyttarus mexicanus]|nr:hypothetical protein M0802_015148 [Mischocyttarus mexicanus]